MSWIDGEHPGGAAQLLSETCHDMRQPVAGVLALAGAALSEPDLPDAARARLEQIVNQAEWLADMIQQWLLSTEPRDTATCQTDLGRAVSAAAAAERLTCAADVNVVWPTEPLVTSLHPVVLRRIVANLLGNAARAAGASGTVIVEMRRHDGWAMLTVDDSGPGFGRIQEGFGLGLSASARSMVKYGGRVECGHSGLGGARVSLYLPLAETQCSRADATNSL